MMALVILGAFDACFAEGGAEHVGAEASEEKAKSHLGIKKDLDKLLKAPLIHCNTVALPPTPPSSLLPPPSSLLPPIPSLQFILPFARFGGSSYFSSPKSPRMQPR